LRVNNLETRYHFKGCVLTMMKQDITLKAAC